MYRIPGLRNCDTAPSEAYLSALLESLLAANNSLAGSEPGGELNGRWHSTYRARWVRLARPIDFGLVTRVFELPEYICADPEHDCIVHLEAREYILGSGYAPWESEGQPCGDQVLLAAYPTVEGPEHMHLEPLARELMRPETSPAWRSPGAPWGHRNSGWSLGHEGYSLELGYAIDFDLVEREFILPPNIVACRRHQSITDKYTWAAIYGSRTR